MISTRECRILNCRIATPEGKLGMYEPELIFQKTSDCKLNKAENFDSHLIPEVIPHSRSAQEVNFTVLAHLNVRHAFK